MSLTRSDFYGAGRNADYKAIRERNWNGRVLQKDDYNAEIEELKSNDKSTLDNEFDVSYFFCTFCICSYHMILNYLIRKCS